MRAARYHRGQLVVARIWLVGEALGGFRSAGAHKASRRAGSGQPQEVAPVRIERRLPRNLDARSLLSSDRALLHSLSTRYRPSGYLSASSCFLHPCRLAYCHRPLDCLVHGAKTPSSCPSPQGEKGRPLGGHCGTPSPLRIRLRMRALQVASSPRRACAGEGWGEGVLPQIIAVAHFRGRRYLASDSAGRSFAQSGAWLASMLGHGWRG